MASTKQTTKSHKQIYTKPIMKIILPKSILVISVILPLTFLTPVHANNASDEENETHVEQGIGIGPGAAVGGLIAGPIGIISGAFIGSLIGQNVANENKVITLNTNRHTDLYKYLYQYHHDA